MLKKTITYTDYNGEERTEDFYFNLSKRELVEMTLYTEGGLEEKIRGIIAAKNVPELTRLFTDIILKAYGEKSPDGKRFMKSDEITKNFTETEAYDTLFMELITDDKAAADFINAIIPKDLDESADNKVVSVNK